MGLVQDFLLEHQGKINYTPLISCYLLPRGIFNRALEACPSTSSGESFHKTKTLGAGVGYFRPSENKEVIEDERALYPPHSLNRAGYDTRLTRGFHYFLFAP
jgi:hypothetical protein